ncbi:hypothetical protein VTP01DRAFT_6457 [Rhizomucor pusillus]|uniref:uncharacterized protein n=1 Tax=Rhizomucor pusillus TaxID=4840 RepID=UPI00374492A7
MILPSFAPSAIPNPWYKNKSKISDELKDLAQEEAQIEEEKEAVLIVSGKFPIPGQGSYNEIRDDFFDLRRADMLRGVSRGRGSSSPVYPISDPLASGFSDDFSPL